MLHTDRAGPKKGIVFKLPGVRRDVVILIARELQSLKLQSLKGREMPQHPRRTCISRRSTDIGPNRIWKARYWDIKRTRIVLSSGPFAGRACTVVVLHAGQS